MGHIWYPVHSVLIPLLVAGGAGPSDVVATETCTVTETAVAELFPVATDSLAITETASGLALVVAVDAGAITEDAQVTQGASDIISAESLTITDTLTDLLAAASGAESATVTELAVPVASVSASETPTITESAVVLAIVTAADGLGITDTGVPSTTSGSDITTGESLAVSEHAVALLTVAGNEAPAVTETAVADGQITLVETLTVSEAGSIQAPFVGIASGSVGLSLRVLVVGNAGASTVTWDSTLITFDSTLTTFDGGYLGDVPGALGIAARIEGSVEVS